MGRKMVAGVMYVDPEGMRVGETERLLKFCR